MLDRKPLANRAAHKNQGSFASPARMLVARTPHPQAQLQHYSSFDSSPILLYRVPENASSPAPDQRTQAYDCRSRGSVLPLDEGSGQAVPLDRTLAIPFKTSMCRGAIIQLVRATPTKAIATTRIGRSGLPQARRNCGAVLRHPGGESVLLAATKSSSSVSQAIPELLRNAIQNLWRELPTSIERIQQEEAHSATLDQGC